VLGLAGDDVVEGDVDLARPGQDLGQGVGDRVDRVPVDGQPDADIVGADRSGGRAAGGIRRPLEDDGSGREASSEGDQAEPVTDGDAAGIDGLASASGTEAAEVLPKRSTFT
jgi:hypothetical protein